MINDLLDAASLGGRASDWLLVIHSNAFGWLLAWSLVYMFDYGTPSQGCLEKLLPGKVKQLQAVDWSLAIHFIPGRVSHLSNQM